MHFEQNKKKQNQYQQARSIIYDEDKSLENTFSMN